MRDEVEVVADARQGLLLNPTDIALITQQKMQCPRHCNEIRERCAGAEKQRRGRKERQEGAFLLRVEPGSYKAPQLRCDDRKAHHERSEQRNFDLREEGFEHVGIDELALPGTKK